MCSIFSVGWLWFDENSVARKHSGRKPCKGFSVQSMTTSHFVLLPVRLQDYGSFIVMIDAHWS